MVLALSSIAINRECCVSMVGADVRDVCIDDITDSYGASFSGNHHHRDTTFVNVVLLEWDIVRLYRSLSLFPQKAPKTNEKPTAPNRHLKIPAEVGAGGTSPHAPPRWLNARNPCNYRGSIVE